MQYLYDPPFFCQHFKLEYIEIPIETPVQYLHDFLWPPKMFHLHTLARVGRDFVSG